MMAPTVIDLHGRDVEALPIVKAVRALALMKSALPLLQQAGSPRSEQLLRDAIQSLEPR